MQIYQPGREACQAERPTPRNGNIEDRRAFPLAVFVVRIVRASLAFGPMRRGAAWERASVGDTAQPRLGSAERFHAFTHICFYTSSVSAPLRPATLDAPN